MHEQKIILCADTTEGHLSGAMWNGHLQDTCQQVILVAVNMITDYKLTLQSANKFDRFTLIIENLQNLNYCLPLSKFPGSLYSLMHRFYNQSKLVGIVNSGQMTYSIIGCIRHSINCSERLGRQLTRLLANRSSLNSVGTKVCKTYSSSGIIAFFPLHCEITEYIVIIIPYTTYIKVT